MSKKLLKSVAIYGVGSTVSKVVNLFLIPVYTRVFSPEDYGIIDVLWTVSAFGSILAMLQLESAVARFYFESATKGSRKELISTAFWTIVLFSSVVLVVSLFASTSLSFLLFGTGAYSKELFLAMATVPFSSIFAFLTIIIRFENKPLLFSIVTILQLIFSVAISILLVVFLKWGIVGVFYGQLIGNLLGFVISYIRFRDLFSFMIKVDLLKVMLRFSLPLTPAVAINYFQSYGNRFVMLGYLSLADIGLSSVAVKLTSVFKLLESAFRMAWPPFFWETFENPKHKEIYRSLFKQVTLATLFLVVLFSCFSKELLAIFVPPNYWQVNSIMGCLALAMGLNIIVQLVSPGPDIAKKTYLNTVIYCISTVVSLGFLFLLTPRIGLVGVAVAQLLGVLTTIMLFWYVSEKLYFIGFDVSFFVELLLGSLSIIIFLFLMNLSLVYRSILIAIVMGLLYMKVRNSYLFSMVKKSMAKVF